MTILDIILLILILSTAYLGYRKGFVRSVSSLLATVVSFISAYILSRPLAGFIYETLNIRDKMVDTIKPTINEQVYSATILSEHTDGALDTTQVENLIEPIKEAISKVSVLTRNSVVSEEVAKVLIRDNDIATMMADPRADMVNTITEGLVNSLEGVIMVILSSIVLAIIFFLLRAIIGIITRALTSIFDAIPLFGTTNRLLGVVVGMLKGILYSFVIVMMFYSVTSIKEFPPYITQKGVEESNAFQISVGLKDRELKSLLERVDKLETNQ